MSSSGHIVLTSHGTRGGNRLSPIHWGALDAKKRGPLIASLTHPMQRNVIGTHGGAYTIYQALSVTSGRLDPDFVPDLGDTYPTTIVGPHPQWGDEDKIVSLDPFGAMARDSESVAISRLRRRSKSSKQPNRRATRAVRELVLKLSPTLRQTRPRGCIGTWPKTTRIL